MSDLLEKIEKVKDVLSRNSNQIIKELEKIADFKNHPDTELLEFEIHDLDSIVLYPMTKDASQVFGDSEKGYFVGHYTVPFSIGSVLQEFLEHYEKDFYKAIIKVLIEWFSDCWDSVKDKVCLPSYIAPHDSVILFDLSNKRWGKTGDQYA